MKASKTNESLMTKAGRSVSGKLKLQWSKLDATYRRSIVYAAMLHAVVLIALTVGWSSKVEVKPIAAPSHINAVVIDEATLEKITHKKQRRIDAAAAKQKKQIEDKKKKQQALKKKEQQKKQALAKKKLAQKKKKDDARKKALLKKKKDDKRKLEEKKKREVQQRKADEKKKAEQKRKQDLQRKEAARKAQQEKELQEKKLQEMTEKAEREHQQELKLESERLEKQRVAQEAALQAQIAADRIAEMSEVDRFTALIREKITRRWHKPVGAKVGQRVELRIELFPTGELNRVSVVRSSGHIAFDNSALSAARSISRYPIPKDSRIFEKNFRRFTMAFSHQDN